MRRSPSSRNRVSQSLRVVRKVSCQTGRTRPGFAMHPCTEVFGIFCGVPIGSAEHRKPTPLFHFSQFNFAEDLPARPMFFNLFYPSPLVRHANRIVPLRGLIESQVAWAMTHEAEWATDSLFYDMYTGGLTLSNTAHTLPEPFAGVYRLHARLKLGRFAVTVDVPATSSFYALHAVILDAVGFDDDRLWIFYLGDSRASATRSTTWRMPLIRMSRWANRL